ncbi:hypothetical protein H257_17023 [Aphanomyces astaci]|uniref:FYVE-type domain-containing protein n=1 Tax=Aphanomyces astaci TaxID=112090 RepID=W4FIQ0_APHAT|nr:hypothetical protein H257_17023 [Aphanomyces astaci]ETV66593.1 hypothetical protein H257_17023 [Aphanomyces astaci]|eukprot:XP_009843964.1 hypothetical protein H257_17023 [Aphanomyces astaci]
MSKLPPHFFRCPLLSDADTADLKAFAEQASIDSVRHARLHNGPIKWSIIEDDHDLQVLSGYDPAAPAGVLSYGSTTYLYASIDDVASLFRAETDEEYQTYRRQFAPDLLDGAPLYTLTSPTPANPRQFVGIKWMAVASPVVAVVKHRDFCAIECRYDFDTQGRRGYVRCLKSVSLACCPDLEASMGFVRGTYHRLAHVFLETDRPGYLHAFQLLQADFRGNIPTWLSKLSAKKRAKSLGDMDLFLRGQRLTRTAFLNDRELVLKGNRSRCFVCQVPFGTFGTKCSCRKCGEVVCKACSKSWRVHADGMSQSLRVCTSCTTSNGLIGDLMTRAASTTSQLERTKSVTVSTPLATSRGGINAAAALTGRGGSQRRAGTQLSSSAAATPTPRTLYTPKVPRFHKSASTTPTSARLPSSPLSFDFLNESIFQHSTGERSTGFSVDDDLDDLDSSFIFTPTQLHDAPRNSRQLQSQGQQDDRTLTDVPPWHQQQLVRYDPTKAQDPRHTDKVPPLLRDDLDHRNDIIPLVMSP